ncbi:MAG TPA: RsiV family protein [Pyrinomonadaceae bacterium]|nr:RsiV family protein [Pyrinomonadaceae bacterium]
MKRFFPAVISIALVLGGTSGAVPVTAVSAAAQSRVAAVKFVPRRIVAANRRFRYTVKAKYPQAVGAARDPRLLKMNRELLKFVTSGVTEFKGNFKTYEKPMGQAGSYYESEYVVTLAANDLVSVAFGVSTYGEGAAHPNHNTLVFNYDLRSGRQLKLADLFKPNSGYLKVISDYAVKDLAAQHEPDADMDWIREGAGPKDENFQSWNLSPKGLEITFDAYQVASYAAGPREVVIPLSALKDVIDPNGPLGRMQN